jgi:hypothetical protein
MVVATEAATAAVMVVATAVATAARTAPLVLLQAGPRAMAVQRAERLHLEVPARQAMAEETRR